MRRNVSFALIAGLCIAVAACSSPTDTGNPGSAPAATGSVVSPPAAAGSAAGASSVGQPFSSAITAQGFRAYDKAISSDEMDGRKPGTPGGERAKNWIVEQFRQLGLEPGNHGSWFQKVPTVSTTLQNPDTVKLSVDEGGGTQTFDFGKDMVALTLQAKPHVAIKDSDIVFVGYGVNAPESDWNDYKGLDVKGKTVVVLVNDPGFGDQDASLFKGKAMTYYGRWTYKYEEAARQGAAMCLIVHTSNEAAGYPWSVVKNSWGGPQLALPQSEDPGPRLPVAGWLTRDAAQRLFAKAGLEFDKLAAEADHRGFKPVDLKATASIALDSKIAHGSADNVLAMIKGTEKPDEVVVYSAHWDHLGEDDSLKGDKIYNGAIDNGTGISALLEIAKAFAKQKPAPKRSVLFAAVTLEESGLLGSLYYTQHPVFPMDKTVADINMDAMDVIGPTKNLQIIGNGQSQLEDMLKAALKQQGRYASPDATPENGFYYRSDHFSFAKAGVPALMTQTGDDMVNGGTKAGRAALDDYTAHRYHTPLDNFDPDWDFSGVVEDTQALYEVGRELAGSDQWPQWNKDSEFRARREKMLEH
ncbi:MAG TPA: M28 family metallopeptidase [Rhodanobacteraceae bacterium]|jgi:Zn-dependent M28 family amino/carboxypeptidase|nr:M28 family metallopeptidase [Rhodanobacteraceae bacterium]